MKKFWLALLLGSFACGGNLSDEERKKIKEGLEEQKIVRITEPEIMTASLDKGHAVMHSLQARKYSKAFADSVGALHGVKIRFSVPGEGNALAIEQELIDAYIAGLATGSAQENLQKIYTSSKRDAFDTLLYSKPALTVLPDGSEQLDGIWNVYIPKKQIVLEITKTK
jgi:hypothetical protein